MLRFRHHKLVLVIGLLIAPQGTFVVRTTIHVIKNHSVSPLLRNGANFEDGSGLLQLLVVGMVEPFALDALSYGWRQGILKGLVESPCMRIQNHSSVVD